MASLNKVFLIGNLTRDPELRYIPTGQAVTTFTVAINRNYTTQTGEKREEVSFVRVVVWGRSAEVCGEYLSKGSPAFVEGRLQSRQWESQDGQKRSTIEVVAQRVQFLGKTKGALSPEAEGEAGVTKEAEFVPEVDLPPAPAGESGPVTPGQARPDEEVPF